LLPHLIAVFWISKLMVSITNGQERLKWSGYIESAKLRTGFERRPCTRFLTLASFIAFVASYWVVTQGHRALQSGGAFACPAVSHVWSNFLFHGDKVEKPVCGTVSASLAVVFGILAVCLFIYIVPDSSATTATDVRRYVKALSLPGRQSGDVPYTTNLLQTRRMMDFMLFIDFQTICDNI